MAAVAIDASDAIVVTGDVGGSVVVWRLATAEEPLLRNPQALHPKHAAAVVCAAVDVELDIVVTGGGDGMCHIYSRRTLTLSVAIRPEFQENWLRSESGIPDLCSIEGMHVSGMGTIALACAWSWSRGAYPKRHSIHVYNINGRLLASLRTRAVNVIRISYCNEFLVTAGNKLIVVYRLAKCVFICPCLQVRVCALRPNKGWV